MPAAAGGGRELSADMSVGELVAVWYKPVCLVMRDARPRNVEQVEESVALWRRFTGDPPIRDISVWDSGRFVAALKALPGRKYATLGNNTIRKHCGVIQAILDLCGPADREHREGLGLVERVPYIARPPVHASGAEDCFTFDELVRLVEAADAAYLPDHLPCSAGAYMRRLYVLIFNTGLRIGGVMGATWRHYHGEAGAAGPGTAGPCLVLPARTVAKGTSDLRIELNEAARNVIESMRGVGAERIFPWPRCWPASRHSLYDQHALVRAVLPKERRFAFHAVRKLTNNELARINAKACEKALGHSTGRTTVEHYTSRVIVAEALAQLRTLPLGREVQRRLFD